LWQYHGYAIWKACHGKKPYVVFPHGMLDRWFSMPILPSIERRHCIGLPSNAVCFATRLR
jgi:hypothetical protein